MDNAVRIIPPRADPAADKVLKRLKYTGLLVIFLMTGYDTVSLIVVLAAEDKRAALGAVHKTPVSDLLHIKGLCFCVNQHLLVFDFDMTCNRAVVLPV